VTVGGLGEVSFESFTLDGVRLPAVRLMVDRILDACMGCQVAGWRLADEPDAPILPGPARTLKNPPDLHVELSGYRDHHHEGVVTVQMSRPVTEEMAATMAAACGLAPENLYILASRHACLVSAVQVPARGIETAMHRLALEGFDLRCIQHAWCCAPIPPLIDDELAAMGRINDALYHGSEVFLTADAPDDLLARLAPKVVSKVSPLARRPFAEIYREAGYDFHAIPKDAHTPAVLHMTNVKSDRTFSAGHLDDEVLQRSSFGGKSE
jgi:methenyltetrahydromethanopterin cyclohydrolase